LLAGLNAGLLVKGQDAWWPRRDQAYLGVMVDDLTTRGVLEPYRMFTSRAEYRLSLREDNADQRLTEIGRKLGLVDDLRWRRYEAKLEAMAAESERLKSTWVNPNNLADEHAQRLLGQSIEREYSLFDLLRRPQVAYRDLVSLPGAGPGISDQEAADQIEIEAKYAGYVSRQLDEIERQRGQEHQPLPLDFDYMSLGSLSIEVRQKLNQAKPATLGQASRVAGVTPAAISVLMVYLKRGDLGDRADFAKEQR